MDICSTYHTTCKFRDMSPIGQDDVLHISNLTLESFLDNLRIRYANDVFYTFIGDVCVSVNPNRPQMSIYGPEYVELYYGQPMTALPPHIYAIANCAAEEAVQAGNDCAVIITGESGSGKTEASKLLLLFLTKVLKMNQMAGDNIFSIENALLNSNYILEAFGNAKTSRNANSSRFAKYIEIYLNRPQQSVDTVSSQMTENGQHFYAIIHNHMLEKSRVIQQQSGERNFHIFYQLLASVNDKEGHVAELFQGLTLDNQMSYKYLNSGVVPTEKDKAAFQKVLEAMEVAGFLATEQSTILSCLAAILHLGNVDFGPATEFDDQTCAIESATEDHFEHFCRLLALDSNSTRQRLCKRKILIRNETIEKAHRPGQAGNGRDALAKSLYWRLFSFISSRINRSTEKKQGTLSEQQQRCTSIGILDIYGFEVFNKQTNAFEQLLVNYCNEKLHQLFLQVVLRKEQTLYDREDINWQMIEFDDNAPICALMDEPARGIFAVLDEASGTAARRQAVATSGDLLAEFNRRFAGNCHFQSRQLNRFLLYLHPKTDFVIRHYAGDVRYSVEDFAHKNMEQLLVDYKQLMYDSTNPLIKEMWIDGNHSTSLSGYKAPPSTSSEYRRSMDELLHRLGKNRQFYVRCIKPNEQLDNVDEEERFCERKVRHQIQYLGLVENARVRKAGFVKSVPYRSFIERYQAIYRGEVSLRHLLLKSDASGKEDNCRDTYENTCKEIFTDNGVTLIDNQVAFGKTLLFFREFATIECLELKRSQKLAEVVLQIQTYSRLFLAKHRFARMKMAAKLFTVFFRFQKSQMVNDLIREHGKEITKLFDETPKGELEYHQLPLFEWLPRSALDGDLQCELQPFLVQLNNWLVILKFSFEYWIEKLLREEASRLFAGKKADWGEKGPKWRGNYLASPVDRLPSVPLKAFFSAHPGLFQSILFGAYVLKTNVHNLTTIRGLLLTESCLVKLDIDRLTAAPWLPLEQLSSISLTPGTDQLVVLHTQSRSSDLVFSFCSMQDYSSALEFTSLQDSDSSCKVGEFVTLLSRQYTKLTKKTLPINFQSMINFKFANRIKSIEAKTSTASFERFFMDLPARLSNAFTLKRFHELYCQLVPRLTSNTTDRSLQKLVAKRVQFEMPSRGKFTLLYNL